jgi:hypothetical protein
VIDTATNYASAIREHHVNHHRQRDQLHAMAVERQSRNQQFDLPLANNHTREQAALPAATACSTVRNLPQ